MGLARPRSPEKKEKKSHFQHAVGTPPIIRSGTNFGRLVGPADLITPVNFNLDRLRTGCVALHESFQSFRFSALHRLSPLTQLGLAGPLVIICAATEHKRVNRSKPNLAGVTTSGSTFDRRKKNWGSVERWRPHAMAVCQTFVTFFSPLFSRISLQVRRIFRLPRIMHQTTWFR